MGTRISAQIAVKNICFKKKEEVITLRKSKAELETQIEKLETLIQEERKEKNEIMSEKAQAEDDRDYYTKLYEQEKEKSAKQKLAAEKENKNKVQKIESLEEEVATLKRENAKLSDNKTLLTTMQDLKVSVNDIKDLITNPSKEFLEQEISNLTNANSALSAKVVAYEKILFQDSNLIRGRLVVDEQRGVRDE